MIDSAAFLPAHRSCQHGHSRHATRHVDIHTAGFESVAFPDPLIMPGLEVFAYEQYVGVGKDFCPGREGCCIGLAECGCWEPHETRIALDLLARRPGSLVLDFGANVGWYSVLAGQRGHRVIAFEGEAETVELLERNVAGLPVQVVATWLDECVPRLRIEEQVYLLKSDVEGNERHMLTCCMALFGGRKIDFALVEISPCLCDYGGVMSFIMRQCAYDAFVVPSKLDCASAFNEDPLSDIRRHAILPDQIEGWLASVRQRSVLFARPGAWDLT